MALESPWQLWHQCLPGFQGGARGGGEELCCLQTGLSQRLQPRPCWTDIQAVSQAAQGLGLLALVGSGSHLSKLSLQRVPVLR